MPKRKSTHQSSRSAKKQRRTVEAEQSSSLLTRTSHNASQSLICRLPPEVRQIIWDYLVGDRLLHFQLVSLTKPAANKVVPMHQKTLSMRVCIQERSWQQLHEKWTRLQPPDPKSNKADLHALRVKHLAQHGHQSCSELYDEELNESAELLRGTRDFRNGLALLLTCKMIHQEVQHSIWTKNIFSFNHYDTLRIFIQRCSPSQRLMLKSLRISVGVETDAWNAVFWKVALPESDIERLKGLTDLHVYLREAAIPSQGKDHARKIEAASMCVDNFRALPLTKVTIIIDSNGPRFADGLSHSQRVLWASQLQQELLQPVIKKKRKWDGISWNKSC